MPWPRPSRIMRQPEKILAISELPDHPPYRFQWQGRWHNVKWADGPERIAGEWWVGGAAELLADFEVEVENGGRYWIIPAW